MDYEKKYNEALERAKAYHRNELAGSRKEMTEYIFPELRESEDERIRKAVVSLVYEMKGTYQSFAKVELDQMVDWLEKQKEQKPNYCHHEVDETGWTEEYRKAYYDGWNNCNMRHEQLKADHKHAEWSEEDEKKIGRLRSVVNQLASYTDSLDVNGDYCEGDYAELDTWLKSLRPVSKESLQPHWKPSEEQMEVLLNAEGLVRANNYNENAKILASLYEQLKKL